VVTAAADFIDLFAIAASTVMRAPMASRPELVIARTSSEVPLGGSP